MNETCDTRQNALKSLIATMYALYPAFNSKCFLSCMSIFFKKYSLDNIVQELEVDFLRPNEFRLNNFDDVYTLLDLEAQKHKTKQPKFEIFKEISTILSAMLENSEQNSTNNNKTVAKQNDQYFNNIISAIDNAISQYTSRNSDQLTQTSIQQCFDITNDNKNFTLTPTKGISFLNTNPYLCFIE